MKVSRSVPALLGAALFLFPASAWTAPAKTKIASLKNNGEVGTSHSSGYIDDLSDDGQVVAFESDSKLVAADDNGVQDIYARNLKTGRTRLVSVRSNGEAGNSLSKGPAISGNGRFVAFLSEADNLIPNDDNMNADIFIHNLKTRKTEIVSIGTNGEDSDTPGDQPSVSFTGRFVAFHTASQLVGKDGNHADDVYLRDRKKDRTSLASLTSTGEDTIDGDSEYPWVTNDGRFVAFESVADDLVPEDNNGSEDIFVRDRKNKTTRRVSIASNEEEKTGDSSLPSISADGKFVVFGSAASFVGGDDNAFLDVYARNVKTGKTLWLSKNKDGEAADGESNYPTVSANGRMIGFYSYATDLVPSQPGGGGYLPFVYDRKRGKILLVQRKSSGAAVTGLGFPVGMTADGRYVLISTYAKLAAIDTNNSEDMYRRGPLY